MIENIKTARYFEVLKSKYLHCYLILLFSLSICQKVTRTMLTYHDSSGSFSHRYICNCNEVRNIDLKGPQKAIIRARDKICQRKYNLNQQKATYLTLKYFELCEFSVWRSPFDHFLQLLNQWDLWAFRRRASWNTWSYQTVYVFSKSDRAMT